MINADRTPETTPTVRGTIRLIGLPAAMTVDVRTIPAGPHEGELDAYHLTELAQELATAQGSPIRNLAVTADARAGHAWTYDLRDASTWGIVGTLKVHAGAGA